jgi:hypothetical protein
VAVVDVHRPAVAATDTPSPSAAQGARGTHPTP